MGMRMQSYIRHREWALCGPCRHGICSRRANRYKRQATGRVIGVSPCGCVPGGRCAIKPRIAGEFRRNR